MDKTVCELFAGVGGFRLGLERSSEDWNVVWANQWEPGRKLQHAFDCYCTHFGNSENHVNIDIGLIDKNTIPDHNLLVGGFPCQDYSVARTGAKGIQGRKGVLWWEIRDILDNKKPKFVLLENVDRLLKSPASQRGRDFGVILACFNELGYSVEWRVINAADYGFVQRRRRTFIFAYRDNTSFGINKSKFTTSSIINNTGFFAEAFPINDINAIRSTTMNYNSIADISDNFKYGFGNAGYMHDSTIYTCDSTPKYVKPTLLSEIIVSDADEKYYLGSNLEKWIYLKGAKQIERTSKSGHKYTFSEGPIAFPDPLDRPARTMLTSESALNRSTHVIEDPFTKKYRLLTPIEAERIQDFDDNWTDTGMPEKFRYFCMGNALVIGVITRMGEVLNNIFAKESDKIKNKETQNVI